jgi:hypothetical protein
LVVRLVVVVMVARLMRETRFGVNGFWTEIGFNKVEQDTHVTQ